uniref:type II toxin-antitoxin system RelE/ParE family toxin n=1 Tax=Dactylococcopsis salina TaxID=292566 RepID=UPI00030A092E|nr:type II toxin-antitoxin system RelE/ParE family toxin [Dactylococcopsis salina]
MKARFVRIAELIAEYGLPNVGRPYVKHLEGSLWEIRMTGKDGISRALYVTAKPKRVVVVRVFIKKNKKPPEKKSNLLYKEQRR